ncbi:pyridoxamine 5'-phosphate oxidase family protein [Streptomyces sp. TS71-3]|uniref:pyridoxamine 5'-phosphate oxidase family protein n=1 Tax=Streptomyces sp. TS71-3 TaxID=2733862 RepID=UPI001B29319D|nr:pyridoxamine 5'-phosphate oxidase family protein [Streptomyces sp. TS71-3]GHJ40162.1 hypothetical protein Sm713_57710 [Streptomyces sp. TS71-3]
MTEPADPTATPDSAVHARLTQERNVWLCTLRPDGSPHVTPVWFVCTDPGGPAPTWWIGVDARSVKIRNITSDPRVTLALEDGTHPVVAEGKATVLAPPAFPQEIRTAFYDKYTWDITEKESPGERRALIRIPTSRWLLRGTAR